VSILFWRKPKLPAGRRPPLEPDERVLAWALTARDQVVVATNRGLWLPDSGGASRRLSWDDIHKASWSGRELVIIPSEVVATLDDYQITADLPQIVHSLPEPGDIPIQVRTRVTKSVGYTQEHALPGQGSARVVARRRPGVDGVRWTVRLEGGADIDDPVVREVTKELVHAAIEETSQ
jgi:hypothetical protein